MPAYRDVERNSWKAVFRAKMRDGKVKQFTKRGFRTKKEAEAYIVERTKELATDMGMTVGTFIKNKYMPDIRLRVKERTYHTKEQMIKAHILNSFIAQINMNDVGAEDIIQWQREILTHKYSECYNRTLNNQVVGIFNHAVNYYGLAKSPCKGVVKIGKAEAEKQMMRYWTQEEFNFFLETIDIHKDRMYHLLFQIQFYCGLRIGETLALTKQDIDLNEKCISISKTFDRRNKKDIITAPKTKSSRRIVYLPDALNEELKDYIGTLYKYPENERIFPVIIRTVEMKMQRQMEKAGVDNRIRVHDLRHSCASFYIRNGADMYAVQRLLGHASIEETIRTYSHFSPEQDKQLANLANQINQKKISS